MEFTAFGLGSVFEARQAFGGVDAVALISWQRPSQPGGIDALYFMVCSGLVCEKPTELLYLPSGKEIVLGMFKAASRKRTEYT